jgi:phosphoglycerate dehydrogenase-like enzyme
MYNNGKIQDATGQAVESGTDITLGYGTPDVWFSKIAPIFIQAIMDTDSLKWFQSSAAGIEHPVLQMLREKAEAYTTSHEQSEAIAEWALWAGFDWLQKGNFRRAAQVSKTWKRIEFRELAGTHWLIVGFGAIGQATARKLRGLGAKVTGVRRTVGVHKDADMMIQPDAIKSVLGEADVVLLCLPHTPETNEIADMGFFTAMRSDALFANVGRGMLVDEAALLWALEAGEIDHAALDVTVTEPLPAESPIWNHPKVTLTAHLAADTLGSARRTDRLFLRNLDLFLDGKTLENIVEA